MVIDASVAVKWFLPEDDSVVAVDLVATGQPLRAPSLLMTEVANALWKKLRKGEAPDQLDLLARHADLESVIEVVDDRTSDLAVRALELGLLLDHAVYDCMYLAFAEAEDDVLVTADDAFRRKVGVTPLARHVRALA